MSSTAVAVRGRVANGVVVLEPGAALPDGTEVTVTPTPVLQPTGYPPGVIPFTPEEQAEFDGWDQLSAEAFQMIEDLERQERDATG